MQLQFHNLFDFLKPGARPGIRFLVLAYISSPVSTLVKWLTGDGYAAALVRSHLALTNTSGIDRGRVGFL